MDFARGICTIRHSVAGLVLVLGAGCGIHVPDGVTRHIEPSASPAGFTYCYGHGCGDAVNISLTAAEWGQVQALFPNTPSNAAQERARIAAAVALLESMVGAKVGTDRDVGGTASGWFQGGQLDCYDEAINTSNFIGMMQRDGLLHFHRLGTPLQHGIIEGWSWPHATAVIAEIAGPQTGLERSVRYAVDSWFHDNGTPPEIVTTVAWKAGWQPGAQAAR